MRRAINCKTGSELRVTTMIFANIFSDAAVYNNTVNITYVLSHSALPSCYSVLILGKAIQPVYRMKTVIQLQN